MSDFLACRSRISGAAPGSEARGTLELSCVQRWVKTAGSVPSYDQKMDGFMLSKLLSHFSSFLAVFEGPGGF